MSSNSPSNRDDTPPTPDEPGVESPAVHGKDNRRQYRRVRPDAATSLTAGLSGGAHVKLLDLSRGGAQFESDRRLNPNSTVSLRLVARDETIVVSARVVRSRLIKLQSGGLGYVVAVSFNEPLQADFSPDTPQTAPPPSAHATSDSRRTVQYVEPELPPAAFAGISESDARAFEAALANTTGAATMTATVESPSGTLRDVRVRGDW